MEEQNQAAASDDISGTVEGGTREGDRGPGHQAGVEPTPRLSDEALKAVLESIIYVSPEPVSFESMVKVLPGEDRDRIRGKLEELVRDFEGGAHGICIRPVAGGYKFSSKPEHHEVLRTFVKSLKPPMRLSKPALETLAVVAYRQPVTLPEIEQIRGVDCGGVMHTLMQKKLVVTSGRKNVIGRPILYRTSRDFLVHFGLKDVGELPSLREFEELARQALGSELNQPPNGAEPMQPELPGSMNPGKNPSEESLEQRPKDAPAE